MRCRIAGRDRGVCCGAWRHSVIVWVIALLVILWFCRVIGAATAYYSATGAFTNGTETQSFLFNLNSTLRSGASFTLRTWHYGGGTNAAGDTIAAGGFDPILRLYNDTPALIAENDDYNSPTVRDSLINWSTSGMPTQLPADNYQLNLVAHNNSLGGRTGNWAVDLLSDAAKFTLTGVAANNGTGAATVKSLAIGSDDARLQAKLQVGPLTSFSIAGPLIVGDTGGGEVTVTTGALTTNAGAAVALPILGHEPGSVGTVTLKLGGSWVDNVSIIELGWQGTGNLVIESGGIASFNNIIVLGEFGSGVGTLTVRGWDSILTTNQWLSIGESGTGIVRIEDRGRIHSAGAINYIGTFIGGQGTVEVDGKDSLWSTSTLVVGNDGQGTLGIANGGKTAVSNNAYIGRFSNGHDSSVTLAGTAPDGTQATWQVNGDLYIAGSEFSSSNATNSKLTINPGGLVDVTGTTTVWNGGGELELLGGEMETGSLVVKPAATFTHHDGMLTVVGGTFDPGVGSGDYAITGGLPVHRPKVVLTAGASGTLAGKLLVGNDNFGELAVEGGRSCVPRICGAVSACRPRQAARSPYREVVRG